MKLAFQSGLHPGRVLFRSPTIDEVLAEPACGVQRFILRELIDGPRNTAQLIARIYNDGEDEPGNPAHCVYVQVCRLRKKLSPGWEIGNEPNTHALNARGPQRRYELRRVP